MSEQRPSHSLSESYSYSMTSQEPFPRGIDRFAIWLLCGGCLAAILFWGSRLALSDFREAMQVAQVGHYAAWRTAGERREIVEVGTDRRLNDIVLHDRKASSHHFVLERKGGKGHWWARLTNRSRDRRIVIRAKGSRKSVSVNVHQIRDGDQFLLSLAGLARLSLASLQQVDWCSPSQVLRLLRLTRREPVAGKTPVRATLSGGSGVGSKSSSTKSLAFAFSMHRFPIRVGTQQLKLTMGTGRQRRSVWLNEHQRYAFPGEIGGGWLEYRHQAWHRFAQKRWRPLASSLTWTHRRPYMLEWERSLSFSTTPRYTFKQAHTSCAFPLRPEAIPGGLEIAGVARLFFKKKRLFLQHLGQRSESLQILPGGGEPRVLGSARLADGDLLSVGRLTYRVRIDQRGVRMMMVRPTSTMLLPFFAWYPSHHFPKRRILSPGRRLLLSGGGGGDPQAERWTLRTSLRGTPGDDQLLAPFRPFLEVEEKAGRVKITPLESSMIYLSNAEGTLTGKQLTTSTWIKDHEQLYFAKRFYFRVFQPSYAALAWCVALVWMVVCGGVVWILFWFLHTGRLRWSPVPPWTILRVMCPARDLRLALVPLGGEASHEGRATGVLRFRQQVLLFGLWGTGGRVVACGIFSQWPWVVCVGHAFSFLVRIEQHGVSVSAIALVSGGGLCVSCGAVVASSSLAGIVEAPTTQNDQAGCRAAAGPRCIGIVASFRRFESIVFSLCDRGGSCVSSDQSYSIVACGVCLFVLVVEEDRA